MRKILLLLLLIPVIVHADFRHSRMGARPRAMGSAFVSLSNDQYATIWNPAGLTLDNRTAVSITRAWPFSIPELQNVNMVLDIAEMKSIHFGAAFTRLGIDNLYYEDTYNLSAAMEVPFIKGLSIGSTVKMLRLEAPGYEQYNDPAYNGGDSGFAYDVGLIYNNGNPWTLGAAVYNLNEPYLQLLSTTVESDPVYSHFAIGGSYLFREILLLSCDLGSREGGWDDNVVRLGTEIWFFDTLALRSGINNGLVTMGFGLQDKHWQADFALESFMETGNVYTLSFTVRN